MYGGVLARNVNLHDGFDMSIRNVKMGNESFERGLMSTLENWFKPFLLSAWVLVIERVSENKNLSHLQRQRICVMRRQEVRKVPGPAYRLFSLRVESFLFSLDILVRSKVQCLGKKQEVRWVFGPMDERSGCQP